MSKPKILMIVTSHGTLGDTGEKTGLWLEELAVPYMELTRAGAEVDIASPLGGRPPVDPRSEPGGEDAPPPDIQAFLADAEAQRKVGDTRRLDEVAGSYDAVFVAGGHGVMWDLASSEDAAAILSRIYANGGVVAAVCHGPIALVGARQPGGAPLVQGLRVTGFSNEEEQAVGLTEVVPYLLESRLRELGGKYECGPNWAPFVVRDGRLVTGQNPSSSRDTARETLAAL